MKKSNTDKITSGDKPDINLENPSYSKDSFRDFGGNQKLLHKNSSLDKL